MIEKKVRAIVEALLFVSPAPLSLMRISTIVEETRERVQSVLDALQEEYTQSEHGLQVVEVAGGYQLTTRPEISLWLKRLDQKRQNTFLSKPSLEVLAIIAYRQPITRSGIEAVRGVDCCGVLKTLLERRLIKIVGRAEGVGRPILYGTAPEFLQHFGLKALSELPSLAEFAAVAHAQL